jgi:hypothetical protein
VSDSLEWMARNNYSLIVAALKQSLSETLSPRRVMNVLSRLMDAEELQAKHENP